MDRIDLIRRVADETEQTQVVVAAVLHAVGIAITRALQAGEKVSLPHLGKFKVRNAAARVGSNPRTGKPISIPAKRKPIFSASKDLCAAVRDGGK